MRTFKRICIEDYVLEAENGDRLELKRGEEYITSPEHFDEPDMVTVFASYWARVPMTIFAGARIFTDEPWMRHEDAR